jgi:hypothetical protein
MYGLLFKTSGATYDNTPHIFGLDNPKSEICEIFVSLLFEL